MKKLIVASTLVLAVSFTSVACKKKVTDADLQTQATTVVTANPQATVEVKDGTAHLSGTFEDEASRDQMIASLKAIPGIKDVMDMSKIEAPVVVETVSAVDPAVQQKVTDAVKDFPSVSVEVVNGELTLTGNVSPEQARKIKMSVDALQAGKVNYNYTVK